MIQRNPCSHDHCFRMTTLDQEWFQLVWLWKAPHMLRYSSGHLVLVLSAQHFDIHRCRYKGLIVNTKLSTIPCCRIMPITLENGTYIRKQAPKAQLSRTFWNEKATDLRKPPGLVLNWLVYNSGRYTTLIYTTTNARPYPGLGWSVYTHVQTTSLDNRWNGRKPLFR